MIILTLSAQPLPPRCVVLSRKLTEISGLCRQDSDRGHQFWAINDGQNPPLLFRFHDNFQLTDTLSHPLLRNTDWEALTADNSGNLFIGDVGNNLNLRRDLRIYIFNPRSCVLDSICFVYPDQRHFPPAPALQNFNCEAMVWWRDSLHLFSKNVFRGNFYCKHYVLPAAPGNYTAILRDSLLLKNRVVTDAALSRDGRTLALTAYFFRLKWGFLPISKSSVFFFDDFPDTQFFKGRMSRRNLRKVLLARQVEAITHVDGNFWLIGNEQMAFNRASLRRFRRK